MHLCLLCAKPLSISLPRRPHNYIYNYVYNAGTASEIKNNHG